MCPSAPHFRLQESLSEEDVKLLANKYRKEYIFWVTYKINPLDYKHLLPDMATFETDNVEVLLQVLGTVIWAKEHHLQTRCIPKPFIPLALYSTQLTFIWNLPTKPKQNHDCRHKSRDLWMYLVSLLQFWRDDSVEIRIWQGLIRPMSMLANLVKRATNEMLPSGFGFQWKNIII